MVNIVLSCFFSGNSPTFLLVLFVGLEKLCILVFLVLVSGPRTSSLCIFRKIHALFDVSDVSDVVRCDE